jgi:hypothetical protein
MMSVEVHHQEGKGDDHRDKQKTGHHLDGGEE